jgi:hypothetical protein
MVVTEPGWEAQRPVIGWEALALVPLGTRDRVPSSVFPDKWGGVLEVAFSGALPPKMACLSTLKAWPRVWTLPLEASLSTAIRASCHLSFLFSFSRSFFSFSKSLL